jgi:hypothetical protein
MTLDVLRGKNLSNREDDENVDKLQIIKRNITGSREAASKPLLAEDLTPMMISTLEHQLMKSKVMESCWR